MGVPNRHVAQVTLLYVSWVGLWGAVPIAFATYPLLAGIDKANEIFNNIPGLNKTIRLIRACRLGLFCDFF